jgi:hypothetical protein
LSKPSPSYPYFQMDWYARSIEISAIIYVEASRGCESIADSHMGGPDLSKEAGRQIARYPRMRPSYGHGELSNVRDFLLAVKDQHILRFAPAAMAAAAMAAAAMAAAAIIPYHHNPYHYR